ncbi:ubiquitin carboxyl-terminal hydrolase 16-like [Argopecten irradians]|uniref:ubiquitin carboxyl-terminal hydrolase 16-like n=1 Tax=Argopecten irradians TaxID=31199 RepID=UPI0037130B10
MDICELETNEHGDTFDVETIKYEEKGMDTCEVETNEHGEMGTSKCEVEISKERHDMHISEETQERRRKDEIVCRDEIEISQQGRKATNDRSEKRAQRDLENVTESEIARASTKNKERNQTITVLQANEQTEEKNQQFQNTFRRLLTKPIGKRSPTSEACIENSLARFIDNESHEEGMLPCRMCEHVRLNTIDPSMCTKRILVADPPPILALQLNRVRQVNRNGVMKLEKITDQITYPEYLDIHPFSSSFCRGTLPNCYQLYSVIVHIGNLGKGHYESYINVPDNLSPPPHSCMETTQRPGVEKVLNEYENDPILLENYIDKYSDVSFPPPRKPVSSSTASKWFKFNDRKVTQCKHPPHGDKSLSDAYMLFYHEILNEHTSS